MRGEITKRQKELLQIVYDSIKNEGYPPTFDELKIALKIKSNQAILDHLVALEKKDFIKREEGSARGIKIMPLGYKILCKDSLAPVLGTTYAGSLAESIELVGEFHQISSEVQRFSQEVFIIKISGDSMINAGINEGDFLLAQSDKEFKSGDIVIAQIPNGTTVKRFISDDTPPYIYLKPENPNYKIIQFTHEMTLQAKIIGKWIDSKIIPLVQGRFL